MKLKILTWNISYGYGMNSEGTKDYVPQPRDHFESSLQSISQLITEVNPDVVLMQEVDFDSRRSSYIQELDHLSRKTGLLYRDELVSWDRAYVPYPGLNPSRQFGKVVSGGGILSRFPLERIAHDPLPKPRENSALYNYFYLSRYLQMVKVEIENKPLSILNLHLEAFSRENRELHLFKLQDRLRDFNIDIAGGDFNGDLILSTQTLALWEALPAPEPTFPSTGANQILDGFIVKKNRFQSVKRTTLDTGVVSDHFPLLLELELA